MGEERVVGAAIGARIARISAPVDTRSDRTVHPIPLFNEHRGIAAVETPTPGAMTDHLSIEPVFEQAGEEALSSAKLFGFITQVLAIRGAADFANQA